MCVLWSRPMVDREIVETCHSNQESVCVCVCILWTVQGAESMTLWPFWLSVFITIPYCVSSPWDNISAPCSVDKIVWLSEQARSNNTIFEAGILTGQSGQWPWVKALHSLNLCWFVVIGNWFVQIGLGIWTERTRTLKLLQSIFFLLTVELMITCNAKAFARSDKATVNYHLIALSISSFESLCFVVRPSTLLFWFTITALINIIYISSR